MTTDTRELDEELDAPLNLTDQQIEFYAENGYIKIKHVLSPTLLEHYRDAIAPASRNCPPTPLPWSSAPLTARHSFRS